LNQTWCGVNTMDAVTINGENIPRVAYKGQPVVTLRMMDELHHRVEGTARRNFNQHKEQLVENEDYYVVPYIEWSEIIAVRNSYGDMTKQRNPMTFLTQTGYLLLVKTFTDKLAWQIQRELINGYFVQKEAATPEPVVCPSTTIFFDESSGVLAMRDIGRRVPQHRPGPKRKGNGSIWGNTLHSTKSASIWALMDDGKPYRIKTIAILTGLPRDFCNDVINKAYNRGVSLERVKRGVYKKRDSNG